MPPAASSAQFASERAETAQPVAAPPSVVTPSRLSIVHERGISPTRTSARVELSHLRGCRAEPRGSWHLANHSRLLLRDQEVVDFALWGRLELCDECAHALAQCARRRRWPVAALTFG
jgi:hypothetical protein